MSATPGGRLGRGAVTIERALWFVFLPIVTIGPAALVLSRILWDQRFLLRTRFLIDDAFYYLQVAHHVANGQGLTFDGINTTNGFQPLWLLILTPIYFFTDKAGAVFVALAIEGVLMAAGLLLAVLTARRLGGSAWVAAMAAGLLGLLPAYAALQFHGLETALYVCCMAGTLLHLTQSDAGESATRRGLWRGLLLVACNLARTDSLIFSALVVGWMALRRRWREALVCGGVIAVLFGAYLAWNQLTFGELMPVSGAAKRLYSERVLRNQVAATGEPAWRLRLENFTWPMKHPDLHLFGYLAGCNALLTAYHAIRRRGVPLLLGLFLMLKYAAYGWVYVNHAAYQWYYAVDFIGPLVGLSLLGTDLRASLRRSATAELRDAASLPVLAALIGLAAWAWEVNRVEADRWAHFRGREATNPQPQQELDLFYLAAVKLKALGVPASVVIGMHNSGAFGYYSDLTVVNLDGLINGRKRIEYIRRDGVNFWPYIEEAQPIDAYLDFVQAGVAAKYDAEFAQRGFERLEIMKEIEKDRGVFEQAASGGLRLYVKPAVRQHFAGLETAR